MHPLQINHLRNIPGWVKLHQVSPLRINVELMFAPGLPTAPSTPQTASGPRLHIIIGEFIQVDIKSKSKSTIEDAVLCYLVSFHFFIITYNVVQKIFC